jgi:hypothetical protein
VDQITDEERRRIAGLVAEGALPWKLHLDINRSRHAIRRAVVALYAGEAGAAAVAAEVVAGRAGGDLPRACCG